MKNIKVISNYWHFPFEKSSSRYNTIIDILSANNSVELITSNFRHITKKQRNYSKNTLKKLNYKVTLIDEPGYLKNVSLQRIFSHNKFAKNVLKYLKANKKTDIIYLFVPSLSLGKKVIKYAKKNNIRVIIDILDLWPEAFKLVFNIPVLSDIIFLPMKIDANYIYANADNIIAVSETYVKKALSVNKKCNKGTPIYIGVDLEHFDKFKINTPKKQKKEDIINVIYIGTLGHSYNLKDSIKAIKILNEKGYTNLQFKILGDGPLKTNFEKYADELDVNIQFMGRLQYEEMIKELSLSDIAINPIIGKSAASIINKVADYAAAGLPVINTQECFEYRDIVEKMEIGINCKNDANDIAKSIEILINNKKLRANMGKNNRKLAEEKFDRNKSYQEIIRLINK